MPEFSTNVTANVPLATKDVDGLLSSEDKAKLDKGGGGVGIPISSPTADGLMSADDKKKLDSMKSGEQVQSLAFPKPVIMSTSGNVPEAYIVLFSDACQFAKLPTTKSSVAYIVFHNMSQRTVVIKSRDGEELFGYKGGFGLSQNESVSVTCEPNTNRWRVL